MDRRRKARHDAPAFVGRDFGADDAGEVVPGASFERCTFEGTRLQERDLTACRFTDCVLVGANLSVARVARCVLQGTAFRGCKLVGIDWSAAARVSAVSFEDCVLDECAFVKMKLRQLVMRRCSARRAVFSETDLSGADLGGTDLTGASFSRTKLVRADLRGASGYVLSPLANDVRRARVTLGDAAGLLAALELEVHP